MNFSPMLQRSKTLDLGFNIFLGLIKPRGAMKYYRNRFGRRKYIENLSKLLPERSLIKLNYRLMSFTMIVVKLCSFLDTGHFSTS